MNDNTVPRLQARDPGDIAQVVPHLIGFQPHESLVVIVTLQGRIQVTARADLADVVPPGSAEDLLDRIWNRFPTAGAHLIAYTSDHDIGWALLRRCENHLPPFADRGSMIVDADTWHSGDGESGPVDPHGRLAAEAAYLGLAVLPSRAELDARFANAEDTPALYAAQDRALATLPDPDDNDAIAARVRALLARNLPDPHQRDGTADIPQADALQLAALVAAGTGRDLALVSISRDNADQHLQLWRSVVNQNPASGAEMPLHLAGMAAWVSGDGASAVVALERAQAIAGPGIRPHALLQALIDQVVHPDTWPQLRDQILTQTGPAVRQALDQLARSGRGAVWEAVPPLPGSTRPPLHTTPLSPPAPGVAI
ncbi:MAG: DUF4192 domain-containing protein [Propionibacteriaceae bacterium]|jgi:hypothetical protein|nr:DUF4192 domain-containing protein [Propionibacteriaceae bacterium]